MESSTISQYPLTPSDRKCLVKNFPLRKLNRSIQFVVAKPEDTDLIRRFLNDEFVSREPMSAALNIGSDEFADFLEPILEEAKPQNVTVLAVDNGCLCGLFLNTVHKVERKGNWKNPQMKDDYGDDIDASKVLSEKFKRISVVIDEIEDYVGQNMAADVDEYVRLEFLSVHRDYIKNGVAEKLVMESCKWALDFGYKFAHIIASAVGTNRIVQKMGFTEIFTVDVLKYRYHGELIFPNKLADGGEKVVSYVVDLRKLVANF